MEGVGEESGGGWEAGLMPELCVVHVSQVWHYN